MIKRVLIATDGSEAARKAVAFGSDIAAKYNADVILVHVLLRAELSENLRHLAEVEYPQVDDGKPLFPDISAVPHARFPIAEIEPRGARGHSEVLNAVADLVLAEAERTALEHGVREVATHVTDGDPVKRILAVAEDLGADLIVTGTRGLSDLKSLVLGSVSHRLAHLSPVTCVTVR
jgi:nucleotide-binding universal stress UspA family protein